MSSKTVLVRARARISRACVRAYVRVRTRLCAYVCVHVRACVRTCAYVRAISPPIRISLSPGYGYARASLTSLTSPLGKETEIVALQPASASLPKLRVWSRIVRYGVLARVTTPGTSAL